MKIALAIVGGALIVAAPLLWHFAALPWGWALALAIVGFLTIPDVPND